MIRSRGGVPRKQVIRSAGTLSSHGLQRAADTICGDLQNCVFPPEGCPDTAGIDQQKTLPLRHMRNVGMPKKTHTHILYITSFISCDRQKAQNRKKELPDSVPSFIVA